MADTELSRPVPQGGMVPVAFAEKAMASLIRLHSELMGEKDRRVDLYRRLMEKEQAVAELRMYVKLLEDRLAKSVQARPRPPRAGAPSPGVSTTPPAAPPRVPIPAHRPATPAKSAAATRAAPSAQGAAQERPDGWRVW